MRRRLMAALAILAMLFNAAFVIACDLHDLGHPAMARGGVFDAPVDRAGHGPMPPDQGIGAGHQHAQADGSDSDHGGIDWHEVFHVAHGIVQALGMASALSLEPLILSGSVSFPRHVDRAPAVPGASILRPPIVA